MTGREVPRALRCVVVPLVLVVAMVPSTASADGNDYTWEQTWFPSLDGTVLRADVLLPADREPADRHPVILSIGPYFGRNQMNGWTLRTGPVTRFADLMQEGRIFERGYAFVSVDSRGYGGSGGCNDLGGPGEQMDAKAAIEWAARASWSTGKVGMWGKSYDGFTQVMALSEDPVGLEAAVIQSPLIETYRGFHMNGVPYGWFGTAPLYAAYDLAPTTARDPAIEEYLYAAPGTAHDPTCYAENIAMAPLPDRRLPYWRERDIVDAAAASNVPTLWSIGFNDINTKPDNFLPVYSRLRAPKRAWIGQWDHVRGNQADVVGRPGFMDEAMRWLDRYLKGGADDPSAPVTVQTGEGWWRTEAAWPPDDAATWTVALNEGAYHDLDDGSWTLSWIVHAPDLGILTFTPPAPHDVHLAGVGSVTAAVATDSLRANMIAVVYDVAPDGAATMITRGAHAVAGSHDVVLELFPQDWILRAGHRLAVSIRANDTLFFPSNSGGLVHVSSASVTLPVLQHRRTANLDGGAAEAMSWVPREYFTSERIDEATRDTAFPPPLR